MKLILFLFIFTILITGCTDSGDKGFEGLEDTVDTVTDPILLDENLETEVEILSFSPVIDPVVLTSSSATTFAVQVNSGAGDVTYTFKLDGSLLQDSSSPFYNLSAAALSAGNHTVEVVATNSISSDNHIFNLKKNTPPSISLDSNTSQTISCIADTFQLDVAAIDIDGDNLSYSFYLNGAEGSSFLTTSSGLSSASVVFTPNCSLTGNNNVKVRVTDSNGEYNDYTVAVTVTNPNVTSIDSYSPTGNPVVVLSTETKSFIISATGNPPLTYAWTINPGSAIAACSDLTNCNITGGDFSPGNYVLTSTVTDALATSDSHTFNVIINQKPQISFQTPSNASVIKMNCATNKNFQLNVSDANWADGQSHTITWLLDGSANAALTNTDDLSIHPMTSDATFSPNCQATLIGAHKIKAIISDGYESQEVEWNIEVNYFSDVCNNLDAGEICTIAGLKGMGSGLSTETQNDEVRIKPIFIEAYPAGGFFFTEAFRHAVWFYNDTAGNVTVFGKVIPAKTVVSLFGQTFAGLGTDGQSFNNFYLYNPRGLAYSATEDALYVADYQNHQIVRFNSSGQGYRWAGKSTGNTDGASRTSHKCNYPIGLALDDTEGKVFVACYGNTGGADGGFKYFLTGLDEGYTLLRYQANTTTEGTIHYGGGGKTPTAYSITKDPNSRIVYAGDLQKCRIMAISYGDTATYHGSVTLAANSMVMVSKGAACGEVFNKDWDDTAGRLRPYALETYSVGGVTKGIFWSQNNRHFVGLLNLTTSDITVGGQTISPGKFNNVWGSNGVADYSRGEPAYSNTLAYNPFGLKVHNNKLYIADYTNYRIGTLDLSTANGDSDDLVGNNRNDDYDGELPKQANKRMFNYPRGLEYSASENAILIYDHGNRRIRKMELANGNITTMVGRGANGNSNSNPEDPNDAYFQNVGDMVANSDGSTLIYTDYNGGAGVNRNCLARIFNKTDSPQSLYNQSVDMQKIFTVAGNYALGCNTWDGATYNNQQATAARMHYPVGITALEDNSEMYISDRNAHCIFKVNDGGTLSEHVGQCTSAGDISGPLASAKLTYPGDLQIDSDATYAASGNFFLVDRWITTLSSIKYVNLSASSVDIFGVIIGPGEIGKVISTDGYGGAVASFGNQICYSQGANANAYQYPHNVYCVDRSTGITTLRVGKISASVTKAATPHYDEEEGVIASSSSLSGPWGITFDSEGNLYIAEYYSNNIRMVKRWF